MDGSRFEKKPLNTTTQELLRGQNPAAQKVDMAPRISISTTPKNDEPTTVIVGFRHLLKKRMGTIKAENHQVISVVEKPTTLHVVPTQNESNDTSAQRTRYAWTPGIRESITFDSAQKNDELRMANFQKEVDQKFAKKIEDDQRKQKELEQQRALESTPLYRAQRIITDLNTALAELKTLETAAHNSIWTSVTSYFTRSQTRERIHTLRERLIRLYQQHPEARQNIANVAPKEEGAALQRAILEREAYKTYHEKKGATAFNTAREINPKYIVEKPRQVHENLVRGFMTLSRIERDEYLKNTLTPVQMRQLNVALDRINALQKIINAYSPSFLDKLLKRDAMQANRLELQDTIRRAGNIIAELPPIDLNRLAA